MQRKPFKKSHKLRNMLMVLLAFVIVLIIIFSFFGRSDQKTAKNNVSESTTIKKTKSHKKSTSTVAETSPSELPASESTSVAQVPVTASFAASSAISVVTNDATQTPISDNTTAESSVANSEDANIGQASSSTTKSTPASFGNWSVATYDSVAIGSATYDQVRAAYGPPTYLTASDQAYATWQSTSGAKVSIIFTPTGNKDNLSLVASSKSQSGLQ